MKKNNDYNETSETKTENVNMDYNSTYNSDKNKLMIMAVIFILLAAWIISVKDVDYSDSIFDENKKVENTNETDNFLDYLNVIDSLATKNYEFIYTIEPDDENEYFYLRGGVDGEKSLYYKEWKEKEYIYLKKGSNYYVMGINTWKKTSKPLSYEGYDITLYNTKNMYKLLNSKKSYEIKVEEETTNIYVMADINNLIDLYNETAELDKQVEQIEEGKTFINIKMYENDNVLTIEMDLKEYYKIVYGKEFENIFYSFEYDKIGSSSLDGIEDYVVSQ